MLSFVVNRNHLKQNQSNTYNYWSNRESVQFSQLFNHFFISIYFGKWDWAVLGVFYV